MTGAHDRNVHKNIARRWFEAASGPGVMCRRPVHISTAIRRHGLCQKCHGVHGSEEQSIVWTHAVTGTRGPTRLAVCVRRERGARRSGCCRTRNIHEINAQRQFEVVS